MCRASRLTHDEHTIWISADLAGVVLDPLYDGPDVLRGRWPLCSWSEAVGRIDLHGDLGLHHRHQSLS